MPDGSQITDPKLADEVAGLKSDLSKISDQVKIYAEDTNKAIAAGKELTSDFKEQIDKALNEQGGIRARLDDVEQKLARRGVPEQQPSQQTPGTRFIEDERVKQFCADRLNRGRVRVDMANITTAPPAYGGALVPPDRVPGIVVPPQRQMTIRQLLTPGRTSSNSVQYVEETGFTNSAAPVAEGAIKPQSDLIFDLKTVPVSTIAHFMVASKQILDDAPMLQSHIDGRLVYGLAYVEETQILYGDGTGVNLHGIVPLAQPYAPAFTPPLPTIIDTLRLAVLQSELALFPSTGIVLNPIDWAKVELTKDTIGQYIFAQVRALAPPALWSRPIVSTQAMTVEKFLTGAFQLGAQIFDREDANVEISTEDSDNFRRNLVTVRAEERLALAVYRPEAFVYGTFPPDAPVT